VAVVRVVLVVATVVVVALAVAASGADGWLAAAWGQAADRWARCPGDLFFRK
jgi:hypothetical protein